MKIRIGVDDILSNNKFSLVTRFDQMNKWTTEDVSKIFNVEDEIFPVNNKMDTKYMRNIRCVRRVRKLVALSVRNILRNKSSKLKGYVLYCASLKIAKAFVSRENVSNMFFGASILFNLDNNEWAMRWS